MEKDKSIDEENLHKNHRQRVYDRLQKDGLDSFYDHEIIELILFYTVPRMDTNPIAHRLMKEFGSLAAVLDADVKSLEKVQGVSHKSAVLINLMPQLLRRYNLDSLDAKNPMDSFERAAVYSMAPMMGEKREVFYALCLDAKSKLIKAEKIKDGTATEIVVNPRSVVVSAANCGAAGVILTHNHPGGSAHPSEQDILSTKQIALALGAIGIALLDHIIVAGDDAFSFKREGIMSEVMKSVAMKIENAKAGYL